MPKRSAWCCVFCVIQLSFAFSQTKIDSLQRLLTASTQDTNKVLLLSQLCDEYAASNSDKGLEYGHLSLSLAKLLHFKKGVAQALNQIGTIHFNKGEYKDAITYFWQALKINEETGNTRGEANNLSNIGSIYRTQGNYEKALKYSLQALKIDEESGDKYSIAVSHTNIGNIYFNAGNYDKALRYYQQALHVFHEMSDKQNTATVLNNIGGIYFKQNNFQKAIINFSEAIKTYEAVDDKVGIAIDLNNIAQIYFSQSNYKKAIEYYKKSLKLASEIRAKDIMESDYESISEISGKLNDYQSAYKYHKLFSDIKDTLLNVQINKQLDEMAIKYETEKKEKENELLKKESTKQHFLNKRQEELLNYLMLGLVLISGIGLLFFIRSRSKQKTNEFLKELVDLKTQEENELRKAKEAVEQSMKLKEQFLANMSHEIRTPLNAIIGFTNLLHEGNLGVNEKEYIHFIKTAGENLINIVNDILDMSKIESGKIVFEEKPLSIEELFKSLKILLDHKAKEKNLELSFHCNEDVPLLVLGDFTRLTQIFINLIGNAIKFTERGSIKAEAAVLEQAKESVTLVFSVIDTGIGIPRDKLNSIFDRFSQAEADTTRKYGGTGLGLSIVKNLIELQDGALAVRSELNEGTEFSFSLTFKPAQVNKKTIVFLKERPHLKNLKILLAEDNALNVKLVEAVFVNSGIQITVAGNGKEAIEALSKNNFDLILMDMQMPEMDGYQATTYIRQTLKNDIPIIAMTAHVMEGEREKCLQLGMNDYIPKPFNIDVLFETIKRLTNPVPLIPENVNSEKHINLKYLNETLGIRENTIKEMLFDFKTQMEEDFPVLTHAVSKGDYGTIEMLSHKLKSPASMMGMAKMEKILGQMEVQAISREGIEQLKLFVEELNDVYGKVLREIETVSF